MKYVLLSALLYCAAAGHAQIVYKDLVPDYYQDHTGNKSFDLDADGTADIVFGFVILDPSSDVWFNVNVPAHAEVQVSSSNFISRLNAGVPVSSAGTWKSGDNLPLAYLTSGTPEGSWPGATDKYLAFRLQHSGDYRYGWMRLSIDSRVNNYTVKDYAYQSTDGTPINAGDKGIAGIIELSETFDGKIMRGNGELIMTAAGAVQEGVLYDLSGRELSRGVRNGSSMRFDTNGVQEGTLLLFRLSTDAGPVAVKYAY